ncbi:MAG: glycoside hydrolase family 55 protein [Kiritimatiellae bacterium]|nr:glycoside hydrolase family 55 protein [Kiritimatiellia bacterium]
MIPSHFSDTPSVRLRPVQLIQRFALAALFLSLLGVKPALRADEPALYPDVSRKDFRDTEQLTDADWVGPDGIVYPRWDRAGVVGGIPSDDWPVVEMIRWFPGARDITEELQAAVDAAGRRVLEEGLPGGVVLIPQGTFTISSPITVVYDGVVIRGMGKGEAGPNTGVTRLMFAFDRPENSKPWLAIHRFDGKLTQDSVIMVFGDARYRFNNPDDPVQPNRTIRQYGLRALDADGEIIRDRDQFWDGVTQQAYFRQWDARNFGEAFRDRETAWLQPWIEYQDGEIIEGDIFEIKDIDWEREPVPGLRRPHRRLGGHAQLRGAFMFIGDQWSQRNNRQLLAETAHRGDTALVFENDLTLDENGGLQPGDILNVQATNTDYLKERTRGGHPRQQLVTIVAIAGNRVEIDQPLRMTFPVTEGEEEGVSFTQPQFPIDSVGLEDLVIQFPNRNDWFSAVMTTHARNFWMRDVRVVDVGQYAGFMTGVKNGEIRDCEFIGAHWPKSGGTAYIGLAGSFDSLMENVVSVGQRHAPDFHGGAGNVVRNSNFSGSDLQWHNGYGVEHLVENVAVGDNTFGGSYGRALHTPDTGNQMHSPPGPRNVIWNSDIFGPTGGMHLGGYQQGWIFAYNRIHVERGPAFSMRDRQTDHLIIGNTIIMEDLFSPVLRHGAQGRGANTPVAHRANEELAIHNHGIEMIANTIYGSNNRLSDGWDESDHAQTPLRRSYGNRILPPDNGAPRPVPPFPSIFEAQRAHPEGMTPVDAPMYNPDPDFEGEPDQLRSTGELVAQVNFLRPRDLNENPEEWLPETGEAFGERDGGMSYGWNKPATNDRLNRAGRDPGTFLYDTNNRFDPDPDHNWSIELPSGTYEVEIALGNPRYPNWGGLDSFQENTTYYAIHDILVNGKLLKDRDGHMDRYDVHHAVVEVGEDTDNRLVLEPAPRSNFLRIQFIRVFKAEE